MTRTQAGGLLGTAQTFPGRTVSLHPGDAHWRRGAGGDPWSHSGRDRR